VQNFSRKLNFHYKNTRISGTLQEDQYTLFFIISRSILLRVLNVSDKSIDKIKTQSMFNNFFSKILSFMREIMWNNMYCRAGQATDDNMAHARWLLDN